MRDRPTWRIPFGVLALVVSLLVYAGLITVLAVPLIGRWPVLLQMPVYLLLGVIWLLPLKRFLVWMETGRWY
jgi:hypothetical protein